MGVIKLKQLMLKNFKGIKNLTIDFEKVTNICGENKLGKTTIFDGFTWLLFDKDSKDRSKFEIQPLDDQNNVIHMLETEVEGIIEIDGKAMVLRKILKEKWVKKRGEVDSELKGTETLYCID
ncbi:MAG: AAA family ATPase, partial [Clostridiaceae bacterium]|nr:AAA family ATPase [Clostridiaceae bacterium]